MKVYAAGGAIRDLLLGTIPRDTDFVFAGAEDDLLNTFPDAKKIDTLPKNIWFVKQHELCQLKKNSPEIDIASRDFTLNAMLLEDNGKLHVHQYTFEDLKNKIIRPCSASSLRDDPIRVFRAASLWARLPDFTPHKSCNVQMQSSAREKDLDGIPAEQVCKEVRKALGAIKPGNFLLLLAQNNCLLPWFKDFLKASSTPAGPAKYHKESILLHTIDIMNKVSLLMAQTHAENAKYLIELATWMALCHDLGKTNTPSHILPHHYGHEKRGEQLALDFGIKLKMPTLFIKAGAMAAKLHTIAGNYTQLRIATKLKLLESLPDNIVIPFLALVSADRNDLNIPEAIKHDLDTIKAVTLPEKWHNLGTASSQKLKYLRLQALNQNYSK